MRDRPLFRCAIYTRKSNEQGLEQDFNSLDAQREAAEAYIKSQAHEGWKLLPALYDDGGFSGGSMERPALQRLMDDIRARRIDIVVVYKVDRLTRSLADFAKLVDLFDEHKVSFVSVTQQFNTTTSMGRLTLNMLLSFAQFEREVTAERIRDKIAASKRRGIWMGGNVPIGYEVVERKLRVVPDEAETVRHIYRRYLALGCLTALKRDLDAAEITTKQHTLKGEKTRGGSPFFKGHLAYLLKNRTYLGEIKHKGVSYPGEHEGIVPTDLFNAVQDKLAEQVNAHRTARAGSAALLVGRIYDDADNRMTPSNTHKRGARYRYYVSFPLMQGRKDLAGSVARVSAPELEALVIEALRQRWARAASPGEEVIAAHLRKVTLTSSGVQVETAETAAADIPTETLAIGWTPKAPPKRDILGAGQTSTGLRSDMQKRLVLAMAKSRRWMRDLTEGRVQDLAEIGKAEGQSERYVRMLLPLAFVSPQVVEAALSGRLPQRWGLSRLLSDTGLSWQHQAAAIGLASDDELAA